MKTTKITTLLTTVLAAAVLVATPASADNPYTKVDNEWISLTGTVGSTMLDAFDLKYPGGKITVEMDDWDAFDESNLLETGERVTVYGRIDDGFLEKRTIEASSVYVFDRSAYFYASSVDEEGDYHYSHYFNVYPALHDGEWIHLSGQVTKVDGREFTLRTGSLYMTVDTDEMAYDPMDDEGYQKVKKGDRLSVWGHMDYDLFETRELKAETIVTLDSSPEIQMGS